MFGFDGSGKHNGHDAVFALAMMRKSRLEGAERDERPEARTDDAVERFPVFAEAVRRRLAMGARAYQAEPAREKPLGMLVDEIATECEDLAGWACLLWQRLQAVKARLRPVEEAEER